MKWYQSTIAFVIVFLFALGAPQMIAEPVASDNSSSDLSDFHILVERSGQKINLKCKQGCAWKKLSFKSSFNFWNIFSFSSPQAINQRGMCTKNDEGRSNFLFIIKKTKEGLQLQGVKGTAWESLSFNCPDNHCIQVIDENGMTSDQ